MEPPAVSQPAPETKGWIGERYDADAGLQYLNARYYDPELGMFAQPDWWEVTKPGVGTNRYAYSFGDPVNKMDPGGNDAGFPTDPKDWDPETNPPALSDRTWAQDMADVCSGGGCAIIGVAATAGLGIVADAGIVGLSAAAELALLHEDVMAAADGVPVGARAASKVDDVAKVVDNTTEVIAKDLQMSRSLHGEAALHAEDAIKAGHPSVLTIDRSGATAQRKAAIGEQNKVPGKHLDEYPPAFSKEGGKGASVRAINPRDNLSGGAFFGNAIRGLPNGTRVRITIGD